MAVDFYCEGCGARVWRAVNTPSVTGLCATCEWLCEHVPDPESAMALLKHMRGIFNDN
jgi:hypothetical protein